MKTLLLILLAVASLSLASLANASDQPWGINAPGYDPDAYVRLHSYRVFYLVLENGIVHGDQINRDGAIRPDQIREKGDTLHPYHYTAQGYSESLVWLELLHEEPDAVGIEISDLHWD